MGRNGYIRKPRMDEESKLKNLQPLSRDAKEIAGDARRREACQDMLIRLHRYHKYGEGELKMKSISKIGER